jgi:hypothetical protein
MKSESDISRLSLCDDESSRYLAEVHLQSGQIQRLSWKGLHQYWVYAKAADVEYVAASHSGHYAVFCLTVASGQGGIIAVWNAFRKRWEHVSEGNYIACAIMLEEIPAVISLHYISCWGVTGHHAVLATPINRTLDGFADMALPVNAEYSKQGFDSVNRRIKKAAYGKYISNEHGPLGIFLLDDANTLVAHDAGNLYFFSVAAVANALKKNNQPAELTVGGDGKAAPQLWRSLENPEFLPPEPPGNRNPNA